jgi:uncharacterized Zn-finger protein
MNQPSVVDIVASDLTDQGGIYCPHPKAHMKVWNTHPKVYLAIAANGEGKCPYCGTVYRLEAGAAPGGHH